MPRLFVFLLLLSACRTPPLDYDGGVPGAADFAVSDGGRRRDLAMPGTRDLAGAPTSCCGQAGNPGNELGVGKVCLDAQDCTSVQANICATSIAPNLTFCTLSCTMNGGNGQCGSGAQCQCSSGQCACVPGECTMPPPGC